MRPPITTLLLTTLLACAGQAGPEDVEEPDESSSSPTPANAEAICDPQDLDDCTAGDDIAACAKTAIKYEYEMLEAQKQRDRPAFECHRETFATLLDHACGLGDEQACTSAIRAKKATPPA